MHCPQTNNAWDILPWITAILLTSSPLIWGVRIANRSHTRHFVLGENAYANELMSYFLYSSPDKKFREEMAKKLFNHHDLRGSPHMIIALEKGQKPDDGDSTTGQAANAVKESAGKVGE